MAMMSAKTRAVTRVFGRRLLFKASKMAAAVMSETWHFLAFISTLAFLTFCAVTLISPWQPEIWPWWQRVVAAPMVAAGLAIWGIFDSRRATGLFQPVNWSRPCDALFQIASSGIVLLMDRLMRWFRGQGLWVAKPLKGLDPLKNWKAEPTPGHWQACLAPMREPLGRAGQMAALAPAFWMTIAWGIISFALAALCLPLLALERAVAGMAGSVPARARGAIERLGDEAAADLAREEARDLNRCAKGPALRAPKEKRL
jgi:hypothetical protein